MRTKEISHELKQKQLFLLTENFILSFKMQSKKQTAKKVKTTKQSTEANQTNADQTDVLQNNFFFLLAKKNYDSNKFITFIYLKKYYFFLVFSLAFV